MVDTAVDGRSADAAQLAFRATDWLTIEAATSMGDDPSLYRGLSGVVLALLEAERHVGDGRYRQAIERAADVVALSAERLKDCSLYFGLAGVAVALRACGRDSAAEHALVSATASTGRGGTRCSSCSWATQASGSAHCIQGTSTSL